MKLVEEELSRRKEGARQGGSRAVIIQRDFAVAPIAAHRCYSVL